jgi:ribosomal protein S18 acetylase RimI-like enzyme
LKYRTVDYSDIPQLVEIMRLTRASIARATSPRVLSAFCRDACARRRPPCLTIVIAEQVSGIAGYVVSEVGGQAYWRAFARRHPLAAGMLAWKRAAKPGSRHAASATIEVLAAQNEGRTWQDPGLHIARIQQIAVHPDCRGRGVATELYRQLFAALEPLGVTRVDANIDLENTASLRLHEQSGWQVIKRGNHYFATIDLKTGAAPPA